MPSNGKKQSRRKKATLPKKSTPGLKTTEYVAVTVPKGWKARLKEKGSDGKGGDTNISGAICNAIAIAYGFELNREKPGPDYFIEVSSFVPTGEARQVIKRALNAQSLNGTVEKSAVTRLSVRVTDRTTGATSKKPRGVIRDRRPIAVMMRKIERALSAHLKEIGQ